jgi:hypothetical protein
MTSEMTAEARAERFLASEGLAHHSDVVPALAAWFRAAETAARDRALEDAQGEVAKIAAGYGARRLDDWNDGAVEALDAADSAILALRSQPTGETE